MLRPATQADISFIATLQARPDNHALIAIDTADHLARDLLDPRTRILIWQREAQPEGFVILDLGQDDDKRVELRRVAIANPGQGYGAPMLVAVCNHVFGPLGARRFFLDVAADNLRARRAYERVGFHHEGTLRQHWLRRTGDWCDLAYYGMLRDEWATAEVGTGRSAQ